MNLCSPERCISASASSFYRFIFVFCFSVQIFFLSPLWAKAPSEGYFQQQVNYKIKVSLNDTLHELYAFEEIKYINNSPDTLKSLFFHLWPNAYANNNTALAKQLSRSEANKDYLKIPN